ncbi:hypothetical protein D3C87_2015960 [compost metagenome]
MTFGGSKRNVLFPLGIGKLQNVSAAGFEHTDIVFAVFVGLRRCILSVPQGPDHIGAVDISILKNHQHLVIHLRQAKSPPLLPGHP